ncbi:MAG: glycosyltransferase [Patescibacteria group bacterium]|nr:glycosyltransferase [Patescibacteria group bacterium]
MEEAKIAIVADWLTDSGGAEKVVLAIHRMFPDAPIFTSIYDEKKLPQFAEADVRTSFLQKWPKSKKKHQLYLKWMPMAFEQFDLSDYDIVISSSHSCAKGVITKPSTMHVSYCHTPMRYVWDDCHRYINDYPWPRIVKKIAPCFLHKIRLWDRLAADRVDYFISNSDYIGERIKKYYKRDSKTIYPIVETNDFYLSSEEEDFYLAVGRLIPYKKFDLIVDAFNHLGKPLKIVGRGPEMKRLKRMAGKNIEFLDYVSDEDLRMLYSTCKAFVFPQIEDFGIAPVEAMASGRPVIAYAEGGALETVKDGVSGVFFKTQSTEALIRAVQKFEGKDFDPKKVASSVADFGRERFEKELMEFLKTKWKAFG